MLQDKICELDILDLISIDESINEAKDSLKNTLEIISQINSRIGSDNQLSVFHLSKQHDELIKMQKLIKNTGLSKSLTNKKAQTE
jgi:hypothetical protein